MAGLFAGDFLDGLELDRNPHFDGWLIAQRRRFGACRAALLEQLAASLPVGSDEALRHLERWAELAPFDARAHMMLLGALAERGQLGECEQHLAATERRFAAEELDFAPVREAWAALERPPAAPHPDPCSWFPPLPCLRRSTLPGPAPLRRAAHLWP